MRINYVNYLQLMKCFYQISLLLGTPFRVW